MNTYRKIIAFLLIAFSGLRLEAQPVETMIRGQVSGVRVSGYDGNVNGAISTIIRGMNTVRGDSQPLWIIDGAMLNPSLGEDTELTPQNGLAFINVNDIESIEVIKDISATAIYGSKGANGVIIIKTKRHKGEDEFNLSWKSNLTVNTPVQASEAFRTSVGHNHFVSLSSEKKHHNYMLSAWFRDEEAVVKRNFNRYGGLRASYETTASKVVHFGMNTMLAIGKLSTMKVNGTEWLPEDTVQGWLKDYDDDADNKRLVNSMYLKFNCTKNLDVKLSLGLDYQKNDRYIWYGNGTSFGKGNNGAASIIGTSLFRYNADAVVNWRKYFGDNLLKLYGGAQASGDLNGFNTMNGSDFFTHELRAKGLNQHGDKSEIQNYNSSYRNYAAYAGLGYSYKDIIYVNGLYRADWTPKYRDASQVSYYSADLAVDLRKAFFDGNQSVSTLKIKGGYGKSGREQTVPYELPVDRNFKFFYESLNSLESREWNAGIDMSFIKNRISLHLGYFDKATDDRLSAYFFGEQIPDSYLWKFGKRQEVFSRSSGIRNAGIEADFKAELIRTDRLVWSVNLNGAYNVNQLSYVNPMDVDGKDVGRGLTANANALGYPVNSYYGYKTFYNGMFMDLSGDGMITDVDKTLIGNPSPKFYGGFGTMLSFAGFTLDVLFDGAAGMQVLNLGRLFRDGRKPYKVSDCYVENADFLRLGRVSLAYEIKTPKIKPVKSINVKFSAENPVLFTRYSGWNPDVNCFGDYGSYPLARNFILGVNIVF